MTDYKGRCTECRTEHVLTVQAVEPVKAQTTTMPCTACYRGTVEVWLVAE